MASKHEQGPNVWQRMLHRVTEHADDYPGVFFRMMFAGGVLTVVGASSLFFLANLPQPYRNIVGVLWVYCISKGLYAFRVHERRMYGRLEVVFALISAAYAFSTDQVLGVLAACYIAVRGLDNMAQALKDGAEWWA